MKVIKFIILGMVLGYILTVAVIGLTSMNPTTDGRTAGPMVTHPMPTTIEAIAEDDPEWDCYEDGNLICGDLEKVYSEDAWNEWEKQGGARYLKLNPLREFRVDYIGTAKMTPKLACNELALPTLTGWFVFRATYMDGQPACA